MPTPLFILQAARRTSRWVDGPARQHGSVLIQFALFLSIIVLMLGVVDLGYSFYAKRDLQRIADQAALEAVQGIDFNDPNNINACQNAGNNSVSANWPTPLEAPTTQSVVCGEWSASKYAAPQYFDGTARPVNAAHVILVGESLRLLPLTWNRTIRVEAIARRSTPVAEFSVGTQLLSFDDKAPLGRILSLVGLDLDELRVLDQGGLANAKITPAGLLKALGVNLGIGGLSALSPSEVLKISNLTLLQLLDASAEVIADATAKVELDKLIVYLKGKPNITLGGVKLLDLNVPLLGEGGILAGLSLGSNASDNNAALDLQLGLGNLLKTAIMVGANGHAVEIPQLSILNLVKASLSVVEPPNIAAGPVGTKANSAQVRLNLDIDSKRLPLLGNFLDKALGLRVNLPIQVQSVRADGTLAALSCPDPSRENQPSMDVDVVSSVATVVIGHTNKSASDPENILIKTPLSLNVRGPITAKLLESDTDTVDHLIKDESDWTKTNPLLLGNTVDALLDTVFSLLGGLFSPPMIRSEWAGMALEGSAQDARNAQIEMLAKLYLDETAVNGLYNVDAAIHLALYGRAETSDKPAMGKLVDSDFTFDQAIPQSCALFACPPSTWHTGTFSQAFKAYSTNPYSLVGIVGLPWIGNGYQTCAGLLSSLVNWNGCVYNNLQNLLKRHDEHAMLADANQVIASLKDRNTDEVTCPGALCVLIKPVLKPIKAMLNLLGSAILSPLLTEVLGLDLGKSEVTAREIQCNTAELVY